MKKDVKSFLVLFLTTIAVFSQSNYYKIQGNWVSVKNLSKNNNVIIDDFYIKFTFKGSNLYVNSQPTYANNNNPILFAIEGNLIKTSKIDDSGYIIEKVTKDTLILSNSFEDYKAMRFLMINEKTLITENLKKQEGNDVLMVDKYTTPVQKKDILFLVNNFFRGTIEDNFEISGVFKINLVANNVETILTSSEVPAKRLKKLKEILDKTFDYWDLSLFDKFKSVEIPFTIRGKKVSNFVNLQLYFF